MSPVLGTTANGIVSFTDADLLKTPINIEQNCGFLVMLVYRLPKAAFGSLIMAGNIPLKSYGTIRMDIAGLLFLMRGVNHLNEKNSFDVYEKSLRMLSILQILFVVGGVVMLCPVVNHRTAKAAEKSASIEIHNANNSSLIYPLEPEKNVAIEFSGTFRRATRSGRSPATPPRSAVRKSATR